MSVDEKDLKEMPIMCDEKAPCEIETCIGCEHVETCSDASLRDITCFECAESLTLAEGREWPDHIELCVCDSCAQDLYAKLWLENRSNSTDNGGIKS